MKSSVKSVSNEPVVAVVPDDEITLRPRTVRHWARVWLGRSDTVNGRYFIKWEPEAGEIEVSIQEYGDPRWIEKLFTDMISVSREYLADISAEYSTVRLRVNLYTHQADGRDQKFTLEHMERR